MVIFKQRNVFPLRIAYGVQLFPPTPHYPINRELSKVTLKV